MICALLAVPMSPPPDPLVPTGTEALLFILLWSVGVWTLNRRAGREAAMRFGYLYLGVVAAAYLVIPQDSRLLHAVAPALTHAMAVGVAAPMGWSVDGATLMTETGPWTVIWGCLGIVYMMLGSAAFLLWPSPLRTRLKWTAAMLFAVVAFNVFRVIIVYLLWWGDLRGASEWLHRGTGVFFTVIILAVWVPFLRRTTAPPAEPQPEPRCAEAT